MLRLIAEFCQPSLNGPPHIEDTPMHFEPSQSLALLGTSPQMSELMS